MSGCQNYGPFLGTLNIRCRIMTGTQKGTIILTTTHVEGLGMKKCAVQGSRVNGLRSRSASRAWAFCCSLLALQSSLSRMSRHVLPRR